MRTGAKRPKQPPAKPGRIFLDTRFSEELTRIRSHVRKFDPISPLKPKPAAVLELCSAIEDGARILDTKKPAMMGGLFCSSRSND
jgi:hypothetical protein